MDVSGSGRGRKHLMVREYLRSLVASVEPGAPTPSERDLADRFGVARMTVRHAVDALAEQGLVERIPGKGTFVAGSTIDLQARLTSYTEEMERRGKRPGSDTVLLRQESAGPGVARALEVAEGDALVHWQRVRLADGEPMAIQHAYLPLERAAPLLDESAPPSLYRWLDARGLMPTTGEDSVTARVAETEVADLLGIEPGEAVLRVSRRALRRGRPIEVSRSTYRADRYSLWVPVERPDRPR